MYAVTCVRTHKGPVLRTMFIGPIKKGSNTNIILCSYICVCVYICMCVCMYVWLLCNHTHIFAYVRAFNYVRIVNFCLFNTYMIVVVSR